MIKKEKEIKKTKEIKTFESEPLIIQQTDFYTLKYIERVWDISIPYLREQIKNANLKAYKVGKAYFVTHIELIEYITKTRAKD